MKNFNRVFVGLLLGFGLMACLSHNSDASVVARTPKKIYGLNYTAAVSSVTAFTILQATSTLQEQPGAVYQLILGTGASGDYLILYDTIPFNTATLTAGPGPTAVGYQLGPRYFYSSASTNTVVTFDPPLKFFYGLMAINSTAANQAGIVYEPGAGLTGQ